MKLHSSLGLLFSIAILFPSSLIPHSATWAQYPIVIAHRGASGYLPEHTLAAKALAHGQHADYLEQDLVLTKDGVPIVSHDIHLDTVTDVAVRFPGRERKDGRYYAIDFTLAEIRQLNVNERVNHKNGKNVFPTRFSADSTGLRISTFEEELTFIAGLNSSSGRKVGVYPEVKKPAWHLEQGQDLSAKVIELLRKYGYMDKDDNCWLQCFEWPEVKRIRGQLQWQGRLVQLLDGSTFSANQIEEFAQIVDGIGPGLNAVINGSSPANRQVTDLVSLAHQHQLDVHAYTVRADELPAYALTLDDLHRLLFIEAKVDGLFTDFPDLTSQFLESQRIATTKLSAMMSINLWPATPPGKIAAKGVERDTSDEKSRQVEGQWVTRLGDVSQPTLTLYPAPPQANTGTCVMVCPGGGYNILAWNLEGTEVCQWLNSIGVSAALLKYRVPRVGKDVPIEPLQDAQRALSILRSRASEWHIRPDRIGVLGFSAGGHLSARVSTRYDQRAYEAIDDIDQTSSRPDFALLIYPAYLFDKNREELIQPDLPVNPQTPPMFLTMAMDDPIDPENVLRMSTALKRAKVANEVHLYPTGGHGYGLRKNQHAATSWPQQAERWMQSRGLLQAD